MTLNIALLINTTPLKVKCKKKSLAVSLVLDALVEALKEYIKDFEMKIEQGNDQSELIRHQEMVKTMEAELQKLETKKRRMFDSWEADDGTYTRDEFIERKKMYTVAIDNLKEQISNARQSAPEPINYEEKIINLHALIDCINNKDLDAKQKNDFLKQFIDSITYDVIDYGPRKGGKPILEVFLK